MAGIEAEDAGKVGSMLGVKYFGSDLIAYTRMGELRQLGRIQVSYNPPPPDTCRTGGSDTGELIPHPTPAGQVGQIQVSPYPTRHLPDRWVRYRSALTPPDTCRTGGSDRGEPLPHPTPAGQVGQIQVSPYPTRHLPDRWVRYRWPLTPPDTCRTAGSDTGELIPHPTPAGQLGQIQVS